MNKTDLDTSKNFATNPIKEIALLTQSSIQAALRNPVFLFMGVITPILYLTLFPPLLGTLAATGALGPSNILTLFVPGMLPIIAFSTGLFTGFGMIDTVRSGVLERLRVTPARRISILLGHVCFDIASLFFQALLFLLLALPFGFRADPLGLGILFLLLALLTLITSSFGNAMALIVKNEDRYAPIVHGIHLPVLLLSGTLLPMSLAPGWLNFLAHCNPVYYVVTAARRLAIGEILSMDLVWACCVLIPFALFTLFWATGVFKRAAT